MSIHYRQQGSAILILGNTYAFRDQLKALGARFNGGDRNWRVPFTPENLSSVAALCERAGGGNLGQIAVSNEPHPSTQTSSYGAATASMSTASMSTASLSTVTTPAYPKMTTRAWDFPSPTELPANELEPSLTIRQLMERLESAVTQAFPASIWVTGEVQNLARKGSGTFFDLAEARVSGHANATVTVRAIIWSGALASMQARRGEDRLNEVLQEGLQIRCLCQVQLYKDRGSVSLLISDIDPAFTKGALALAREKLLKELRAKGLEQANKRLERPAFPLRIGLISAEGSRAKSDFLDQLASLAYPGTVVFVAAVMQGEQVPKQVVQALSMLAAAGCDLIVMTRGGGSAADLRWFDAPEIAYAIAQCPVPIVAAIGHHEDVCVAEEICHMRQKTPTAAADFVVSICLETRAKIEDCAAVMAKTLAQRLSEFGLLTAAFAERLQATAARALESRRTRLADWASSLQHTAQARVHKAFTRLNEQQNSLQNAVQVRVHRASTTLNEQQNSLQHAVQVRVHRASTTLNEQQNSLQHAAQVRMHRASTTLSEQQSILQRQAQTQMHTAATRLTEQQGRLNLNAERRLGAEATKVAALEGQLLRRDPSSWLEQGWTRLSGATGLVKYVRDVRVGDKLRSRLVDGWLSLTVEAQEVKDQIVKDQTATAQEGPHDGQ